LLKQFAPPLGPRFREIVLLPQPIPEFPLDHPDAVLEIVVPLLHGAHPARIPSTRNAASLMFVPHFPPTIVKSAPRHFVSGKEYLLQSS
jgi:hypothetical protein